jgi:PAS domain-containing protein
MFSITVPIIVNDSFLGVVGTDFDIESLWKIVESVSGNGRLITDKGTNAVHHDSQRIGLPMTGLDGKMLENMSKGKMFQGFYNIDGRGDFLKTFVPIYLIKNDKPWYYVVDIPKDEIDASARSTVGYMIVYFLVGVVLISFAGWALMRPILNDVSEITGIIQKLSLGNINIDIRDTHSLDELGEMHSELRLLVEGLKNTAGFAHSIGEGKLDIEYRLLSDGDVLGNSLLEMRQSLRKSEIEHAANAKMEEQRNWGTSGLAKFAEILRRDSSDLQTMSYSVISNLVKYLGANQGGIFVINDADENDKFLELTGCYAFDRKKFSQKRINLGEGLAGTCCLEGEPVYMTNIPDEYISITSGMGDSPPKALFICPLKLNDEILGVIELASFEPFEPYQREFVEKVSESIASTISSAKIHIHTSRLLEQSKLQAEEMANSEEELRQNMEEMQATQEESRRREAELQQMQEIIRNEKFELQAVMDAIDGEFARVTYDVDMNMNDLNDYALKLFGYPREMLTGTKITAKMPPEEVAVFTKNWNEMLRGKIIRGEGDRITAGGVIHIWYMYIPIIDVSGKTVKVMMMGQETQYAHNHG